MTLFDYISAAIVFGINDSFNPYALSMVLCSLCFLASIGNTTRNIILSGWFVIGTTVVSTFLGAWGENMFWLEHPAVNRAIHFLSLGVAVFLLVVGYLLFQQWWQSKTPDTSQRLPLFLLAETVKAAKKDIGFIFVSMILGLAAVLLGSLWPKDQNIYILYYFLFTSGNGLLATLFFALYGLAYSFPFLAVWGIVFWIKRSGKLRNDFLNAISWVRVCFAAIFIAVGLGLIYLFVIT